MKRLTYTIVILICIFGTTSAQTITVESDRMLDADFSKYKSFAFASQVNNELDPGYYLLNDLIMKSQIRDAVEHELTGLGYAWKQTDPDLIINFRVFDKAVTLQGFEGYGMNFWGENYRQISDTTSYNVKPGTLLVSMADRKSGQVVWQGFASGLIKNNLFLKDEGVIRQAVNLIFEEYNQRATEYTRK